MTTIVRGAMPDFYWLNDDSRLFLSRGYIQGDMKAEDRIRQIAQAAQKLLPKNLGFEDRFYGYMARGWVSLASPVWANFGTDRGLPISCNGCYVADTMQDIILKTAEIGMQTKMGAGTSAYFGDVRPRGAPISTGGTTHGPVHFLSMVETFTNVISQSNVRRGFCAVYLDVEHPDIEEFLECREEGNEIQHLALGVCIGDAWMESMIAGDKNKQQVWRRILRKRFESGYPYLFFKDTTNNNAPQVYKDKERTIFAGNLCNEISLSSSLDESFVCCLSSLNVLHYDEWKDSLLVEDMVAFLDAVMEEYIIKTANIPLMQNAHNFAKRQRAVGLGTLGWHSLLQSKMIPFESEKARELNIEIHHNIANRSEKATIKLAGLYGEPEMLIGYGRRNVTTMAIAPTTSSSFILGQISPSIEPLNSNYFVKDLAKGKFTYKNPYLMELLESKGINTSEVWKSILVKGGSVEHLDELTDKEKAVFKTFGEISQLEIVQQAADRQKYIDQSQSLNLMIHPKTPMKDVNALLIEAWRLGVKSLYYHRSTHPAQELARNILSCVSCEV
jgi:ribonucleoside-diphosphate reductase alpha chain